MATHSSILAWRIPWTEEPGGLQSIALQRVRHDWSNLASTQYFVIVKKAKLVKKFLLLKWTMHTEKSRAHKGVAHRSSPTPLPYDENAPL